MRALRQAGYTVTIVSNNAADMIRSYLNMHELTTVVRRISARSRPDTQLKPDPFPVEQAKVFEDRGVDAVITSMADLRA